MRSHMQQQGLSTLHMCLLGQFTLTLNGQLIDALNAPRLQSVLAYLVLQCSTAQPRQRVAAAFWPDASDAQARNNLRQTVHQLRQVLPEVDRYLQADASTLRWCADATFGLDVAEYERAAAHAKAAYKAGDMFEAQAAWVRAANLYQGDLLPSCYEDWIAPKREQLRQEFANVLKQLIEVLEQQRDFGRAIAYAQRLLALDPLDEAATLGLMRLHALNDDRASALRVYGACAKALQQELGIEPNPALRESYERLVCSDATSTQASRATPRPLVLEVASPLIGRQPEWAQLQAAWQHAVNNEAHLALVSGEAGIGKTRLAEELLLWASRQGIGMARARAYAAEGRLSYAPVTEWLRSEAIRGALPGLDNVWLSEIARILPEILVERPDVPKPESVADPSKRQHLFEALARAVLAARQPLLLVIDDLQWCDQETLEWLRYLLRFDASAQILVIGTVRAEEVDAKHPLTRLLLDVRNTSHPNNSNPLTEIELKRLDAAESAKLAGHILSRTVELSEATRLYSDTEGNPLFIVEMARAGLGHGRAEGEGQGSRGAEVRLPPRVHAVMVSRLAQLSDAALELAGLGATIGRAFSVDVLAQASGADEEALLRSLDELWQRRIVRAQEGNTYDFTHDKLRDVAYSQLGPAKQRLLHRRAARAIEAVYASDLDAVSAQLAAQYERAGMVELAVQNYERAARVAKHRFAGEESINLCERGLSLLAKVTKGSINCDELELSLLTILATVSMSTRGFNLQKHFEDLLRVQAFREKLGKVPDPAILRNLGYNHVARSKFREARRYGEQLLELGRMTDDTFLMTEGHQLIGVTHCWLGEFEAANEHFDCIVEQFDPQQSKSQSVNFSWDSRAAGLTRLGQNLWCLGYPERAKLAQDQATFHLDSMDPNSIGYTLFYDVSLRAVRGDVEGTYEYATRLISHCQKHNLNWWLRLTVVAHGWAVAALGDVEAGIAEMETGIDRLKQAGTTLNFGFCASLLASTYVRVGKTAHCLDLLDYIVPICETTEDVWFLAEQYRLRGDASLAADNKQSEFMYQHALTIARKQNAKSLELRAATSFARLWQSQGKLAEAHNLLQPVYNWFTEGFDTHDLIQAKALLDVLSQNPRPLKGSR